jgi:type IV secretory pathway ATPase VirB11/archaellum biosynthesis ATPase
MCRCSRCVSARNERQLSESQPELDMQLPDGSRMTVLYKVSPAPDRLHPQTQPLQRLS